MSIVLVVIGLLIGGVLAGQELIYASRIRKMGTELQQISVAVNTFRIKFDCLPGDCANATTGFVWLHTLTIMEIYTMENRYYYV